MLGPGAHCCKGPKEERDGCDPWRRAPEWSGACGRHAQALPRPYKARARKEPREAFGGQPVSAGESSGTRAATRAGEGLGQKSHSGVPTLSPQAEALIWETEGCEVDV